MMCASVKQDKRTEAEVEADAEAEAEAEAETETKMEFSMASTIYHTLFQYFRKMRGRFSRISWCIKFKAKEMELRSSLYGVSMQGSSSQLIQHFISFNCVPMSNQARTTCQIQTCLVVVYSRPTETKEKKLVHFCTNKGTKVHLLTFIVRTQESNTLCQVENIEEVHG
ncbi:hypothetical protein GQ457_01G039020 [Hibiscus cannabinus]